jgi:Chromo (CHRromatin Organisation MOdifier) domain
MLTNHEEMLNLKKVRLSTIHTPLTAEPASELKRKWIPLKIVKMISSTAYKLDIPSNRNIHPVLHISRLLPYTTDDDRFPNRDKPASVYRREVTDIPPDFSEVENVIKTRKRVYKGRYRTWFLIKWKNFPPEDNSWEPFSSLNAATKLISKRQKLLIHCTGEVAKA